MTRYEAAALIRELWGCDYHYLLTPSDAEAVDMAIEALEQQDKRCKACQYFHNINIRLFNYYCPNCGAKMEVLEQ